MDLKDPKNQKIILIVIVLIIVSYFWYSKSYTKTNEEIQLLNFQLEKLELKRNQYKQKAKTLEELKAEYNDLEKMYLPMKKLLPEEMEFSAFLNQVHAAAQATRSVVLELEPNGIEPDVFYDAYNYTVSLATTYHDVGNFLANVTNFPFIINVSKIDFERYEDLPKMPKMVDKTMQAKFTMTAYNAKKGTQTEKE